MDRYLRRLEAMMIVANPEYLLVISGSGEVIEPDEGVIAIGSGGSFAYAAARAYLDASSLSPREIAEKSLRMMAASQRDDGALPGAGTAVQRGHLPVHELPRRPAAQSRAPRARRHAQ
jgi:hypothetical protein